MFRQSVSLSRINPLQAHRPLLRQPGLDPFLVGAFILQRYDCRHALPFALAGSDTESALERRGDEELVQEADLVTLGDVVWCRGDGCEGCGRDGVQEILVSALPHQQNGALRIVREENSLFPLHELDELILIGKPNKKPHFLALLAFTDPWSRGHP